MSIDLKAARKNMVESQVRTNDVSDTALIDAMFSVHREDFTSGDKDFAYAEVDLPTPSGRPIMKARSFAKLAQAAEILPGAEVLVIAGAGLYTATIFKKMGAKVTIIDNRDCELDGVETVKGDILSLAELNGKKFDVVFVDGATETIPQAWFEAVKEDCRLALFKYEDGHVSGYLYTIARGTHSYRSLFEASVSVLPETVAVKEFVF